MKKLYILIPFLFLVNGAMGQWLPQFSGTTNWLISVYFTDVNTGFAVGSEGVILKTTDGGINWYEKNSGTSFPLFCVYFPKPDTGYILGLQDSPKHLIILKTADGGENWTTQFDSLGLGASSLYFTDANTGYIGGRDDNTILKTTDGGSTWVAKNVCEDCVITSFHFPSKEKGFATVGFENWKGIAVFKTINGGESWIETFSDTLFLWNENWELSSIHFPDTNTGYACGSFHRSYGIGIHYSWGIGFKTSNGGSNWTSLNQNTGWDGIWSIRTIYFTGSNIGYMVGEEASQGLHTDRVYITMDGGETLNTQFQINNIMLRSIHFPSPDTGYIVGEGGIILKTTNGGFPVGTDDPSEKPSILAISPNPAFDKICITTPFIGSLIIFNLGGQVFLHSDVIEPVTTIDIQSLPGTIYIVKLIGKGGVRVGKFVKK